jgi:glutamine synthetase
MSYVPELAAGAATRKSMPLPGGADYLDAFIIDINGNAIGKRLPAVRYPDIVKSGVQFSQAALILDSTGQGQNAIGIGGDDADPDGTGYPLDWSLVPVPWARSPTMQCVLDMIEPVTRKPLWYDSRQILRAVIERCAADKLFPMVACELEFYLVDPIRDAHGRLRPPSVPATGAIDRESRNLSVQQVEDYQPFLNAVIEACKVQGVASGSIVAEYGPGQFEINLAHRSDPLRAADEAVLLRRIVKGVARAQGREATFMSKPFADRTGSGFHVHLSLVDELGLNRFGRDGGEVLLRSAIAGYQALLRPTMAFFAPNFSAYRRYAPRLYAPVNRHWGFNNRSVAFRIPVGDGSARRTEHRVAGADASPHLVMAAILAAMHHGVTNALTATEPVTGNVGGERDPECPADLFTALAACEAPGLLDAYIPRRFRQLYADLKRNEFADLMAEIVPREYDYYL